MTESFTELVRKKAPEAKANAAMIAEWCDSIQRLFDQVRGWLKELDPDGMIEVKSLNREVDEPTLGKYMVPRMEFRGLGKWVGFVPKARKTVGKVTRIQESIPERATGRIDILNDFRSHLLYRLEQDNADVWYIVDPVTWEQKLFDKQAFENVLMSYFG